MTLLEREPTESLAGRRAARCCKTARLILRAPRPDDAEAIAALINDRRIAENTARIPHPYTLADAEAFIARRERRREPAFVDHAGRRTDRRRLRHRHAARRRPEIGYWLGVPHWGHGYATEAARALIDHAFARSRLRGAARRRAGDQPGLAARAGEVRLPVDRRGAATRPRDRLVGAVATASGSTAACGHRCGIGARCTDRLTRGAHSMPAPFTIIGLDHVVLRARDPAALENSTSTCSAAASSCARASSRSFAPGAR